MSEVKIARVGDGATHPGRIITGSETTRDEVSDKKVARHMDTFLCYIHGPNPIVGCFTAGTYVDDRKIVKTGDITACGARIIGGSPHTYSD